LYRHAYFCLGNFSEAVDAYERGLQLEPGNQSMKQSLASAKQRLEEKDSVSSSSRAAPAGAGGLGGMDFASMMSNPNFMNMASQMMSNPAIGQMLKNPAIAQM
jgi:small glutamine-rich tetratricopeptide repeat-containing protein alpha